MAQETLTIGALRQGSDDNLRQMKAQMSSQENRIDNVLEQLLMKAWMLLLEAGFGERFNRGLTEVEHEAFQRIKKQQDLGAGSQDHDDITNQTPKTSSRHVSAMSSKEKGQPLLDQQNEPVETNKTMKDLLTLAGVPQLISCMSGTNCHSRVFEKPRNVPAEPDPSASPKEPVVPLKKRGILSASSMEKTSCLQESHCSHHTCEGGNPSGPSCPVDGLSTSGNPKPIPPSSASSPETAILSADLETATHKEKNLSAELVSTSQVNSDGKIAHKETFPPPNLSCCSSAEGTCDTSPGSQVLKGNPCSDNTASVPCTSSSQTDTTVKHLSLNEGATVLKESAPTSILISDDLNNFNVVQEETVVATTETGEDSEEEALVPLTVHVVKIPEPRTRSPKQKRQQVPLIRENLCGECGKTFATKKNLSRHVKVIHESETTYKCTICLQSFRHSHNLTIHKRSQNHYGSGERHLVKPMTFYTCELCDKAFQRECNLEAHFRLHTGERPFKCSYCSRRFAQSSNCKKHERTHTQQRPYACEECHSTFTSSSNMKRHTQSVHGKSKGHLCPMCGKIFSQEWNLKKHEKRHHSH